MTVMGEKNYMLGVRRHHRHAKGLTTAGLIVGMSTLLAFVAVAVDLAILQSCETEARSAADAAALAGAAELWDRSLLPPHLQNLGLPAVDSAHQAQTVPERQMQHCVTRVCKYAAMNTVGGQAVTLTEDDMSFNDRSGAVAMTVQASFTEQRGNPVSRVVGGALGLAGADLRIASQAVLDQRVYGFVASTTARAPVLPIVLDTDLWNDQVATSSIVTIQIATDASEIITGARLCSMQSTAATILIDHREIAPPTLVDHILSGIRKSDLVNLPSQSIALSQDPSRPLDLSTPTVSTATLRDVGNALHTIAGQPRVWMLGGQVTDANDGVACRVTSFVAAKVLACSVDGERLTAVLQPCLYSTSTALVRTGQPRNPWLAKVCLVQ